MGLPDGHPEKDGVLVDLAQLPAEVKKRVAAREIERLTGGGAPVDVTIRSAPAPTTGDGAA